MKRINIKDLAKLLSLNPSTISRALADHPDIKPETKARVKKAAEEFNYIPNLHAKYFRQKSSSLIALVLPEFNMFFTHSLMDGINSVLGGSGYSLIIFLSNNQYEQENEIIKHCLSWVVEGVLMAVSESTENLDHLRGLIEAGIPVVLMDKVIFTEDHATVTIDDRKTAYEATSHLANYSIGNILGIFGNPTLEITNERIIGFKTALIENKISFSDYDIICVKNPGKMESYLEEKLHITPYDSVFIMSDELMVHAYPYFRKLNLYPNQLNIVAISDGKLPFCLYPNITHMHHSGFEVGKKAVEILLNTLQNPDYLILHHQIDTFLVKV